MNAKTFYVGAPSTIRVQLRGTMIYNGQTNYQYWRVSRYSVKSIPFNTYIKDVLPNEWDSDRVVPDKNDESTKKWNSLKAGTLMVKTFSWYMCYNPWNPSIGAHVNDDASQAIYMELSIKVLKMLMVFILLGGVMCSTALILIATVLFFIMVLMFKVTKTKHIFTGIHL